MILAEEYRAPALESPLQLAFSSGRATTLGSWGLEPRSAAGDRNGGGVDIRVWAAASDLLVRLASGEGRDRLGQVGGFSHESEHDLAVMVSDFLENGSGGAESLYSSDSDSGVPDLNHLSEMVLFYKHAVDQYESDLISVVHSLLLSINEIDLHTIQDGQCNASCIRRALVKLLRLSGYDAAVCTSKWQGSGKVPGGDHEYIDVVTGKIGGSERSIIDIDFRSHFEIARAVVSYDSILNSLPVVYVGSHPRLEQFLQLMVDAAKCSLKQNSMPLPPWRSLSYLRAKWQPKYERKYNSNVRQIDGNNSYHQQCIGHLRRLKASLQSEIEAERLFKPIINEKKRRGKSERLRPSLLAANKGVQILRR